jgi:hypothetical protein
LIDTERENSSNSNATDHSISIISSKNRQKPLLILIDEEDKEVTPKVKDENAIGTSLPLQPSMSFQPIKHQ